MKPGSVKIIDRHSAVEAINQLDEEDLRFPNRLIVEQLKLITQARRNVLMSNFNKGGRVEFLSSDGRMIEGFVLRINKKTISIITDDDTQWNVSPNLLTLVYPAGKLL